MTPQEFAQMLRKAFEQRERSWDKSRERYTQSYYDAAVATCPKEWVVIVDIILLSGYADVWDWCDEVEGIQVVSLDNPAELHNTIAKAVGEEP